MVSERRADRSSLRTPGRWSSMSAICATRSAMARAVAPGGHPIALRIGLAEPGEIGRNASRSPFSKSPLATQAVALCSRLASRRQDRRRWTDHPIKVLIAVGHLLIRHRAVTASPSKKTRTSPSRLANALARRNPLKDRSVPYARSLRMHRTRISPWFSNALPGARVLRPSSPDPENGTSPRPTRVVLAHQHHTRRRWSVTTAASPTTARSRVRAFNRGPSGPGSCDVKRPPPGGTSPRARRQTRRARPG